jgi:hypothetical protein
MIRISITDRLVLVGERELRLTPKFFRLYCLLAYQRAAGRDCFVTCRGIHRLQGWGRASVASIGKEIHRHIRQMLKAGWDLVESPPRGTTKAFRLRRDLLDV